MENLKKYKFIYIILIILFILIYYLLKKDEKVIYEQPNVEVLENDVQVVEEINETIEIKSVKVDIKGSVKNPGVYELLETDRVIDVINLSGGLLENADTSQINLSKKLKDEMVIIVNTKKEEIIKENCNCPISEEQNKKENNEKKEEVNNSVSDDLNKKEDLNNQEIKNDISMEDIKSNEIKNDAIIEDESSNEIKKDDETNNQNIKISLNTATKEQLMTLPGIGESKALAIIEYRNNNLFKSIEEITNIKGIGNSIYESIKQYITI